MASTPSKQRSGAIGWLPALTVIIAVAIFLFTYSGIHRSRQDSFNLLKAQGVTLLETLVESADNAITANTYYWESFIARISPIAQLTFTGFHAEDALRMFEVEAQDITVQAVYKFDSRLLVTESAFNPDIPDIVEPTDLLYEAASDLLSDSSLVRSLIFMPDSAAESATALYLALDSVRAQGICLLVSAPGLWEMESEVGIASLIQRLGSAGDVSYIFFQDLNGLIFASLPIDSLAPIAADSFLQAAYVSDSISSRTIEFDGVETLELVAPFSSALYPDGLFRLGISLERFQAETAAFNQQMIFFGAILFLLAALAPLYFGLRRQRRELGLSLAREQSL
ncbi:MAG TPA: hypothetical protein VLB27_00500, partial [candidate division Zixibacteria bacterium]|nr:hypothetical protein [candidate division Zixibacteria bacterium]